MLSAVLVRRGVSGFINVQGGTTSTVTLEYDGFYKTLEADVEHNGNGTLIDQYNYGEGVGISPNHGDWIASNTSSGSVVFNESQHRYSAIWNLLPPHFATSRHSPPSKHFWALQQ